MPNIIERTKFPRALRGGMVQPFVALVPMRLNLALASQLLSPHWAPIFTRAPAKAFNRNFHIWTLLASHFLHS
jgi:hypothetical protein